MDHTADQVVERKSPLREQPKIRSQMGPQDVFIEVAVVDDLGHAWQSEMYAQLIQPFAALAGALLENEAASRLKDSRDVIERRALLLPSRQINEAALRQH